MPEHAVNIKDLLLDTAMDLPGCTDAVILNEMGKKVRDFCERTGIWVEETGDIDVVADQTEYIIKHGYNANIQRIVWLKIKTSEDDAFENLSYFPEDYYSLSQDYKLIFSHSSYAPSSDITGGMRLKLVLRPFLQDGTLPYWLVDRYGEGIISGVKARLMLSPGKPYTNPAVAGQFQFLYNDAITRAKIAKSKQFPNRERQKGFSG